MSEMVGFFVPCPTDVLRLSEGVVVIVEERDDHVGALSLGK